MLASERASERVVARVASANGKTCVYVCMLKCVCRVDSYTISINVHKNNTATRLRAGRVRAESRTEHWQCDRPGFNRHNFSPDGHVLFNVDRAIHYVVPYGRIIRTVHNVNLYLHRSRQGWVAPVFGHRLQLVRLALRPDRVYNKREQKTTALVSRRQGSWQRESTWYTLLPVLLSERREGASLSLASAGQSLATPCLGHPPTPGIFGASASSHYARTPVPNSHVRWETMAISARTIAMRGTRTRTSSGWRAAWMDDRRSATCILNRVNIAKAQQGSLAKSLPKLYWAR